MSRAVIVALGLAVLTGCAGPNAGSSPAPHERQMPSNTEPGLHVSGHANIGVVRNF
ncbi:hypothetical protein ACFSUD_12410 [Sulfitobacter aestuarii]|uniref:Argininosuccinate lyase n=1 Tax=Sulfitobacter aestuarii TaxID=2161676 RepID=A0ABW5U575_9RHOB